MKKWFTFIFLFAFSIHLVSGQIAQLQIIHNSPSPTVDIWVNNQPFLTNFAFREATEFLEVPAGVILDIGVAPSPSNSPDDIIANFEVTLENGGTYVAIASGVVGNMDTPFTLLLQDSMREAASDPANIDFRVVHGSPDAPAVDVFARDVSQIVDNLPYGNITDYLSVPADQYYLDLKVAGTNPIVATFDTDLTDLAGASAVVFASGFLGDDPGFGLYAAFPNGTVVELPTTEVAKLQLIHNSPEPTVDIWVNEQPFLTDFAYREATEFDFVPAGTTLDVGVAPSPSTSPDDIIASFDVTLENGRNYIAIANGIVGNMDTPLEIVLLEDALEASGTDEVAVSVFHGSPNAPTVDVLVNGSVPPFIDDLAYSKATPYLLLPEAIYPLNLTPADDNENILFNYRTDLNGLGGGAALVFASGLVSGDPSFGLFAALSNGTVIELPVTTSVKYIEAVEQLSVFPNPASDEVTLHFDLNNNSDLSVEMVNMLGEVVWKNGIIEYPRGENQETFFFGEIPDGLYLLQIRSGDAISSKKIMIKN